MAKCTENTKDYELRFDILDLLEELIASETSHSNIKFHAATILQRVLVPCCVWKMGKPNIKIRKAAVSCIIRVVEGGLIAPEELYKQIKDILSVAKNCLDDDWAPDLRFATCALIRHMLTYFAGKNLLQGIIGVANAG